jgi:hypothetical protein
MSNQGSQIVLIQNEEANIKLLAAQREIYTISKNTFIGQCIIAVPLSILVSIISVSFKGLADRLTLIFSLYSIIALLSEVFLDERISNLKKKAASIQELFDYKVLGIVWNDTLLPNKPDLELVFKYYSKYIRKNKLDNFYNWYSPEVKEIQTNLAAVLCQRTNCTYDFSLRRKYTSVISLLALTTFIILFLISASTGITTQSFVVQILAPFAPIFVLAFKQRLANKDSIENLSSLKDLLEAIISNARLDSSINEQTIRQVQDKIYYNRILSPLLPNWVFDKLRNQLEAGMHFSIQEKIKELKSKQE